MLMLPMLVVLAVVVSPSPCPGPAFDGPVRIVRPFGPTGRWSGHFGIDVTIPPETPVRAVGTGTVSFSGEVAGRLSVTIDHGGGIRTSYSYLAEALVTRGQRLVAGSPVGYAGVHGGARAVHLSLRVGETYLDPAALAGCDFVPQRGLWLTSVVFLYPVVRERNPRRHLRPAPLRSSRGRARSTRAARTRHGAAHGGR